MLSSKTHDNKGAPAYLVCAASRIENGIVVMIAHRPSALVGLDLVLVLNAGTMQAFGPKDEVLRKVTGPPPAAPVGPAPAPAPPLPNRLPVGLKIVSERSDGS